MMLAGDIGGTKTLLGLFEPRRPRPRAVVTRSFTTLDYADLNAMISDFSELPEVRGTEVAEACFGVAGPVIRGAAELTNVPWRVESNAVARAFDIKRVSVLNDLQAMAYAVPVLEPAELHTLQAGARTATGNMAVIAAGTGLGQALLHHVDGQFIPSPCEGGHADYAARNERDISLLRDLINRYGRASVEHVVSGRGLVNIHRVTHTGPCPAVEDEDDPAAPAAISSAALERRCRGCMDALTMFVDAYGAEAGNLALRSVATGGLFVGGGIAPKILPALTDGRFIRAFVDKAPLEDMVKQIPVHVILNDDAGLLGAAVFAQGSEGSQGSQGS
jgi:glucokinase